MRNLPGDALAVLNELGVDYYVRDDELLMLCPWHDDTNIGSFSVNIPKGVCYCFACGGKGSLVSLIAQLTGKGRAESSQLVRRSRRNRPAHLMETEYEPTAERDTTKIMNEAKLALFLDPPEKKLQRRGISLEAAQILGILWDHKKKEWILPIRDPHTRKLRGWQAKSRTGVRNHPKGVEKAKALFGLDRANAPAGNRLILVESPLDVARLRTAGIYGGVSSYGARISVDQRALLHSYADEIILALDNDDAGKQSTKDIFDQLGRSHKDIRIWNYGNSQAKDPGEQTDEELHWSLENSMSRFAASRAGRG